VAPIARALRSLGQREVSPKCYNVTVPVPPSVSYKARGKGQFIVCSDDNVTPAETILIVRSKVYFCSGIGREK